jgi:chloramphenicol 3-O-phosphotransferase
MNIFKRMQISFFVSLLGVFVSTPPANAWIVVLNGTSCAGKTTLAENLKALISEPTEIIQYDVEAPQLLKEILETKGYHHDGKTSVDEWVALLPRDIRKWIDDTDDDERWALVQKRIVKKAKELDQRGINVIIDTGLKNEADYSLFANGLRSAQTYFVLVYAHINKLLENLNKRNTAGNSAEIRNPLGPFFQYFWFLAERCDVASPEKLDIITKDDFEAVFRQLEVLIQSSKDEFDDYWISTKDFTKIKTIIAHMFFHTCWSYTPFFMKGWLPWHWLQAQLPCYCSGKTAIGIVPKANVHDFVINTGALMPDECAMMLHTWLVSKI